MIYAASKAIALLFAGAIFKSESTEQPQSGRLRREVIDI
jgi:hypothetical protein